MTKSATDVVHDILVACTLDAIAALKTASKGLPNTLLRDIGAIHANTTFADLPDELREAIGRNVRDALGRLRKEGYTIASSQAAPPPRGPRGDAPGGHARPPRPPAPRGRPDGRKPGGPGGPGKGKPPGKPRG